METKSCNRESKLCSAKYGIFYRFMYTQDSCSANSCSASGTPNYRPAAELSGAHFEIASGAQFENVVGPNCV
ncbi:hypothetical protein E2C01_069924 [Portunus trituberculatus]|uniref:Uncharacterized protein n=1 Tax=Portunus trituberculatus TaxID=210409 RepID=A0A5B7I438_PORTR|nr:hypothetical protein [Portunus trituberculatus]